MLLFRDEIILQLLEPILNVPLLRTDRSSFVVPRMGCMEGTV
jgi:hypothetical protein